jgi:hypothetical protein
MGYGPAMQRALSFTTPLCISALLGLAGCDSTKKLSATKAGEHVSYLAEAVAGDVDEVRKGLPEGAKHLEKLYEGDSAPKDDLKAVRERLDYARNKVQDLRVAKSTFFALADAKGDVLRNDQEQDLMAGKNLLAPFPELKNALAGKYVETKGSMSEAARVKGSDGQWVAAVPITVGGQVRGLYVTGWSWSAYAYRLENALRGNVKSALGDSNAKMPLVYVYVVVGDQAFGAPVSPEVNAEAIAKQKPLAKIQGDSVWVTNLDITGRDFGLAVKKTPVLGPDIGVAVLRSET